MHRFERAPISNSLQREHETAGLYNWAIFGPTWFLRLVLPREAGYTVSNRGESASSAAPPRARARRRRQLAGRRRAFPGSTRRRASVADGAPALNESTPATPPTRPQHNNIHNAGVWHMCLLI